MDIAKLEKMKVAELRNELQARGLDIKGVKALLIERLKAAIDANTPVVGSSELTEVSTPSRRSRRTRSMTHSPSPSPVKKPEHDQALEPLIEEEKPDQEGYEEPPQAAVEEEDDSNDKRSEEESEEKTEEDQSAANNENDDEEHDEEEQDDVPMHDGAVDEQPNEESQNSVENGATQEEEQPEKMEVDHAVAESKEETEGDSKVEDKAAQEKKDKRLSRKRSHSKSRSRSRSRTRDRSHSRSRSKNSRSPKGKRSGSTGKNIEELTNEEDEPAVEDKQFGLSWLDSDLHLSIDPVTFTSAKPMPQEIFSLVWSGARANYGVREGKVCYEVRLSEETNVNHFKDEPFIRGLRCGFSSCKTSLLLGEQEKSFAYCETGKKALNGEFVEYGKPFKLDDVIGCYLDLDSTPCTIQFTLNGEQQGTAFEFDKSILGEEDALFPHVLTKGYEFIVNFADSENLLGNAERPKRLRRKEKPRKDSVKSEDRKVKKNSTSEENWEVVDEAKMDDNENEEPEAIEKKDEVKEEQEATEGEKKSEEKDDNTDEEMKQKDSDESSEKPEADEEQTKEGDDDEKKEDKENASDEKKENGQKVSSPIKKARESRDSNQDYVMEEIEPEEREEVILLPDYELIALTPEDKFISGPLRPESRKECEVYLLVGLPGSGKTHWALNHIKENPDKRYHTIGVDDLIAKMTIDGKPRKSVHKGTWERVYDLCQSSLHSLEEIATKRRRNYILDQSNAFASAQRRKMKGFGDFKRNAVVCIPSEDELKRRNQLKTEAGNESSIRESTLNNLKASFTLPSLEFGWFDNIIFTDLKDDEAKDEVKRYNEKGNKEVDANRDKRPRRDYNRHRDDRRRYDDRRRDDFRGSRWKGNHNDRRGGSGNRRGPPSRGSSGPWRDDRGYGGGRSYDNRNNRYGGSGGNGGGSQNWVNNNRNRYDDRFGRSGGNSGGGGGGGGGGRYDSYSSGSRDYRDRGRDRNGDGGDSGSRRDGSYRSGNQRDFRSGHRDIRTEDSRGGFERSKYSSNDDGYEYNKPGGNVHNNSSSQGKWMQMQGGGNWGGGQHQMQQQQQQQQQDYWGYDQSQSGYGNQQQWSINSADPRQQQWINWYQNNSQQSQQQQQQSNVMQANSSQQQYWSQYSYPNQGSGTTVMSSHSTADGSSKK